MGIWLLILVIVYVIVLIAFAKTLRTTNILAGSFISALVSAILYDAGYWAWWIFAVAAGFLASMAWISINVDKSKREIDEWWDSLQKDDQ